MSQDLKMKKVKQLVFKIAQETKTRNGMFSMLIRPPRLKPRDSMKNLASTSIGLSILFHSFHSTELLRCTETPK